MAPEGFAFDAVILAGGQGSRLGGTSKADLIVRGERLLDKVLRAASGAGRTIVVGDVTVPPGVLVTREDPPGTGPAAGIVAGLAEVSAEWVLVLACDLPGAERGAALLLGGAPEGDGRCLVGPDGVKQHLAALYRTTALRSAAAGYGDPRNRSIKGLVAPLDLAEVATDADTTDDIDTWADHARWNEEQ